MGDVIIGLSEPLVVVILVLFFSFGSEPAVLFLYGTVMIGPDIVQIKLRLWDVGKFGLSVSF